LKEKKLKTQSTTLDICVHPTILEEILPKDRPNRAGVILMRALEKNRFLGTDNFMQPTQLKKKR